MNKSIITIIYDNTLYNRSLKQGWGFSCLIIHKNITILFDTGANSKILLYNMKHLKINGKIINVIFISHMHYDHTGGLIGFLSNNLNNNKNISIYFPSSVGSSDIKQIESFGIIKQNIQIITRPQRIIDNTYSTGSLGVFIKEQSLVIDTEKGLVIITGCAHPGIAYIVDKSIELFAKRPLLVLGGFHLSGKSKREILKIIEQFKKMDVKYVSPCHCSGENAQALFKMEYKDHYIDCGVGRIISIEDLI